MAELPEKSSLTAKEALEALQGAIANRGAGVIIWQAEDEQTGERYDENRPEALDK